MSSRLKIPGPGWLNSNGYGMFYPGGAPRIWDTTPGVAWRPHETHSLQRTNGLPLRCIKQNTMGENDSLPTNITIDNASLEADVVSTSNQTPDIQGVVDSGSNTLTLKIPYTVSNEATTLPAYSKTYTIATVDTEDGVADIVATFSWSEQLNLAVGSGTFNATITTNTTYNVKKLDTEDYATGRVVAAFNYPTDSTGSIGTATLKVVPAKMGSIGLDIPDSIFPKEGNGGYDVQHYNIEVDWNKENKIINATTTIRAKATKNLSGFYLDFRGLTIDTITVNGTNVTYKRIDDDLKIILPQTMILHENEEFTCIVYYHGLPNRQGERNHYGKGWTDTVEGNVVVASEPGVANWFPCNNHPRDKATYSFKITVSKPYVVAASGVKTKVTESTNTRTYFFEENHPMATYLVTVNIAEFTLYESIGETTNLHIRNYIDKDYIDKNNSKLNSQDDIVYFESEKVGSYPFDEVGGIVIPAPYYFALETQSKILYLNRYFPVAHEIAHQWFGNSISINDWRDLWLNEGFATYVDDILWHEHLNGKNTNLRNRPRPSSPEVAPGNPVRQHLFSYVYGGGARVLIELENQLGKEVFMNILRTYVSRYQYKNARTEDFIALAEEVSGRDLTELFRIWLYGGKKL